MSVENGFIRKRATEVIGYYSVDEAEEELKRLAATDPDPDVQLVAEDALARLRLKKENTK